LRRAVLHPSLIASKDESTSTLDRSGEVGVDELISRYLRGTGDVDVSNGTTEPSFAQLNLEALRSREEQECPLNQDSPLILDAETVSSVIFNDVWNERNKAIALFVNELIEVLRTKRKTKGSAVSDSSPEPEGLDSLPLDNKEEPLDLDGMVAAEDASRREAEEEGEASVK
ncbi:27_t:CDS:2, partial [Acaulospora colombiana]